MPIRLRLTLWYSSLLLIIILVLEGAIHTILDRTLRSQVDDTIDETILDIQANIEVYVDTHNEDEAGNIVWRLPDQTLGRPDIYIQLWSQLDGPYQSPDLPAGLSYNMGTHHAPLDAEALKHDHEIRRNVEIDGTEFRVATIPILHNGKVIGHVQVAASLHSTQQATARLLQIMIIGGLVAVVISVVLGNWLAGRVLSPISKISKAAEQTVAADDLSYRIPPSQQQDELGHLITTFNKMLERLEKLFNSQRQFVSDVSHELRTPLTSIQGNVELIQRFGYSPDLVDTIATESQRMIRIVNDLLMLAQADVGQLPLHKDKIALDGLIKRIYQQGIELAKARIEVELGPVDAIQARVDHVRITQLLMILMSNAVAYTTQGKVTLSLYQDGNEAEIIVADTGIGIPKEHLAHIFDRFYRVDKARSRDAGGTGLGLSIAKWIVEAHGGTMTVDSEVNVGTKIRVRLPLG